MRRPFALFLVAVQFLTRIPVPDLPGFQPDWTARAARYFPLVGALVGLICAVVLAVGSQVWTGALPALLAVAAGIALTGAFHEDGLADTADGLGGGQTSEQRLGIMKDSRIGTFGALALSLALALKVAALSQTPLIPAMLALVAAHGAARASAVVVMRLAPYAGDRAFTKVKPVADGVSTSEAVVAILFGALAVGPLAIIAPGAALTGILAAAVGAVVMTRVARRLIGGWVGDTLGATEQVFEVVFLLAVAAVAT